MQISCFAALLFGSGACAMSDREPAAENPKNGGNPVITVVGRLTGEGVECQALRGDDGQLYTLLGGELGDLPVESRVRVTGEKLDFSSCQQGITIRIQSIAPADPRGT